MTKEWDETDYETQVSLAMAFPKLFKTKQTVLPDKKEIKGALTGDNRPIEILEKFSVFRPEPTFVFKGDV